MKQQRVPSAATLRVLEAILSQPAAERYGYELMKTTGLKSGTLYPILMRLHDRGLLVSEWRPAQKPGKPPRQAYRLTATGLTYARSALARKRHEQEAPREELIHEAR